MSAWRSLNAPAIAAHYSLLRRARAMLEAATFYDRGNSQDADALVNEIDDAMEAIIIKLVKEGETEAAINKLTDDKEASR